MASYVCPSKRNNNKNNNNNNNKSPVNKSNAFTSGKKKIATINTEDTTIFPTLCETIKKNKHHINFSSAVLKQKEVPKEPIKSDVLPGWVHIRRHQGKIQYKYGEQVQRPCYLIEEEIKEGNRYFNFRMARDQYIINMDIARLGDLSMYYGEPTVYEMYALENIEPTTTNYSSGDEY